MLQIEKNLNYYKDYFNGINDVRKGQSKKQVAIGILKILSYITPASIYFGLKQYFDQCELNNMKSLCEKVSRGLKNKTVIAQKDLISFLSIRVFDQDKNNFEDAFHKLNLESQNVFFKTMAEKGKLRESIQYLPTDVKKLAINFGRKPLPEIIGNITYKLENFAELETVDIYISEVLSYTSGVQLVCDNFIKAANSFALANATLYGISDELADASLSHPLDKERIACEVINDSVSLLKAKKNITTITIHFKGPLVNNLKTYREDFRKGKNNQIFHTPNYSNSAKDPLNQSIPL